MVLPNEPVSLVVRENDPNYLLPGIEPVTSIRTVNIVGDGGFLVNVKAGIAFGDNYSINPPLAQLAKDHIYGDLDGLVGAVIQAEDAAAVIDIGGTNYARVEYSNLIHYNPASGNLVYGADIDLMPDAPNKTNRIDGVIFVGDTPVFVPGDALPAGGGFSGGTSTGLSFVDGAGDTAFFKASYTNGSTSNGRGLFSTSGQTLLYSGKSLGPSGDTIQAKDFAIGNAVFSDDGLHYIAGADVGVGSSIEAVVIDGLIATTPTGTYAKVGQPVAVGSSEKFASFNQFAINNNGKWAASGWTDAATNEDAIFINGEIAFREGDVLPKIGGGSAAPLFGLPQYIDINNQGDVAFYFGSSDDAGVIVLNGRVVAEIGDSIGGNTLFKFGLSPIALSDRDEDGVVDLFFHAVDTSAFGTNTFGAYHMSLVVYLPGDTDGDGDIDDADLGASFANYTGPVGPAGNKTFKDGDTDNDGDVDDGDLGVSFANYTGPLAPAVPEPASLALVPLSLLACARRRRA